MAEDEGSGELSRPRSRSPQGFEDVPLREMFNRAGFDPDVPTEVQRLADCFQFIGEAIKRREKVRKRRTQFLIWLFGGLGLAIIASGINLGVQWLKQLL